RFRQRDASTTAREQLRGGDAASRRARDGHAFTSHVERHRPQPPSQQPDHRSFSVAKLNSAKMIPTITNRVITFGSLHPINSKWWCNGAIRNSRWPPVALK